MRAYGTVSGVRSVVQHTGSTTARPSEGSILFLRQLVALIWMNQPSVATRLEFYHRQRHPAGEVGGRIASGRHLRTAVLRGRHRQLERMC
jgi:hypothetical protein